jgi:hypothetical protein
MQKSRRDWYCLGIWTADLPGQLLWMCEASTPEMDALHSIPPWAWASKGGNKLSWTYLQLVMGWRPEIKSDQFAIDELGTLEVRGFIKRCSISENVTPARRFSHSHSHSYTYLFSPRHSWKNVGPDQFIISRIMTTLSRASVLRPWTWNHVHIPIPIVSFFHRVQGTGTAR